MDADDRYQFMTYSKHGDEGTVAIRDRVTGRQIIEMNWKGVTLAESTAAAEKVRAELAKGVDVKDAKELAARMKAEYAKAKASERQA